MPELLQSIQTVVSPKFWKDNWKASPWRTVAMVCGILATGLLLTGLILISEATR